MSPRLTLPAVCFFLSLSAAAEAQQPPPAGSISLDVYGEGRAVRYTVFPEDVDPERARALGSCVGGCRFWLPPGKYRIVSRAPDGAENAESVELDRPRRMRFQLERSTGRMLGLAGGTLGPLMILAGIAVSYCEGCSEETLSEEQQRKRTVGGVLAGAGIVATTAGWILFAVSGPEVQVEEGGPPRQHTPGWTFAVVPSSDGAYTTAQLKF
jgi:hypothetical protein